MTTENIKVLITGGSGFIGTNLVNHFLREGISFVNIDKAPPYIKTHEKYWEKVNILSINDLRKSIHNYKPNIIIHLAARTDTFGTSINDYIDNTEGTNNLIKIVEESTFIRHVVITSTQYVYKRNDFPIPVTDDTYFPHTAYGESKVITERITRSSNMKCGWTIIRPVNIWGPWHMRYPNELWKLIHKGFYLHPDKKNIIRTYGYVKNVVHQITAIIQAPLQDVNRKTFYLGDLPIDSFIWVNELSKRMKNKSIKRIPSSLLKAMSIVGDLLRKINIPFPLYSSRYQNMIEDYYAPTEYTIKLFGTYQQNITMNVDETLNWLKEEGKIIFEYWKNHN